MFPKCLQNVPDGYIVATFNRFEEHFNHIQTIEEHDENIWVPSLGILQEHFGNMYGKQFECYW